MQHAPAVDDIGILLERLAAHAIQTPIRSLVEVVGVAFGDTSDQRLHAHFVMRIGGADELVVLHA